MIWYFHIFYLIPSPLYGEKYWLLNEDISIHNKTMHVFRTVLYLEESNLIHKIIKWLIFSSSSSFAKSCWQILSLIQGSIRAWSTVYLYHHNKPYQTFNNDNNIHELIKTKIVNEPTDNADIRFMYKKCIKM